MTANLKLDLQEKQDWTVDDLAGLPEDLYYELLDGRLVLPDVPSLHHEIGAEILPALRVHCPPGLVAVHDPQLRINHRREPCPNIVVIARDQFWVSPVPVGDALLAIEIVSLDWPHRDNHVKAKAYAAAGVASYWVIDLRLAEGIVLSEFRAGSGGGVELVTSTSQVFTTEAPYPVTIDLPALLARAAARSDL